MRARTLPVPHRNAGVVTKQGGACCCYQVVATVMVGGGGGGGDCGRDMGWVLQYKHEPKWGAHTFIMYAIRAG